MSTMVFPNANNTSDSWLLPMLWDLNNLWEYDCRSPTYGYLFHGLDDACRESSQICGVPLVVDVSYF